MGRPRVAVVLPAAVIVRNLWSSGALDALPGVADVHVLVSERAGAPPSPRTGFPLPEVVDDDPARAASWGRVEMLERARRRRAAFALGTKFGVLPRGTRAWSALAASRVLHRPARALLLRTAGREGALYDRLAQIAPDLVVVGTGGTEPLCLDALCAARAQGIPSLAVLHNWDALSAKGAFPVLPDHIGVWGAQTLGHARSIVGVPERALHLLGSPTLDRYLRLAGQEPPPMPGHVLFAGCYAPFDERAAVAAVAAALGDLGSEARVRYRPHPDRADRRVPDRVEAGGRVELDGDVADPYAAAWGGARRRSGAPGYPSLDGYPVVLRGARCVVSPLSTMVLEAALLGVPTVVVAWDDGVHPVPLTTIARFEHFAGLEDLPHFRFVRDRRDLGAALRWALGCPRPVAPTTLLEPFVHHGEETYAARLAALVAQLATGAGTLAGCRAGMAR